MNYIPRLFFLLCVVTACSSPPSVSFSSEIFDEESLDICKNDPCSNVTLQYPKADGDVNISEEINTTIQQHIIEALFLGDETQPSAKTIPEAAKDFILTYRDHQVDIPSEIDPGGYEAEIVMTLTGTTETMVSIKSKSYQYTGGAHGNSSIVYLNFDLETGQQLDMEDLTDNFDEFEKFVEEKFRIQHNIPSSENINYSGFWFADDQFYVSNNIGFSDRDLYVLYNPSEIAPYSDGIIELKIPLEEAEPFLNIINL